MSFILLIYVMIQKQVEFSLATDAIRMCLHEWCVLIEFGSDGLAADL
jgi:hypothetical protein